MLAPLLLTTLAWAGSVLEPQRLSDEAYGETYTAVAALDDGGFVLLQLLFTNAGFGNDRSSCRALWVPKGGEGLNRSENAGSWSYDPGSDTLTVGTCTLGASQGGLRFAATVDDLTITLQTKQPRQPTKPPGHRVDVKSNFYEADIVVPRADATIEVSAPGSTHSGAGVVHIDHSRSNTLLPRVADCWMRFRGFTGAPPALLQLRVPPGSDAPEAWAWPLDEAAPTEAVGVQLGTTSSGQHQLTLQSAAGTYAVTPTSQIYRYRPTEAYGVMGKLASPWIGDPTTTTYAARATDPSGAALTGILEVSEIKSGGCVPR